jgi:hypothetical protein
MSSQNNNLLPAFIVNTYDNKTEEMHKIMTQNILKLNTSCFQSLQSKNIPKNQKLPENYCETTSSLYKNLKFMNDFSNIKDIFDSSFELPDFIPDYYVKNGYYTIKNNEQEKNLHAILSFIDPTFYSFPTKTKNKILVELKRELSLNFDTLYNHAIFRYYKVSRNELYASLSRDDLKISIPFLHLISEYLKVNIIILYRENVYEFASYFCKCKPTIILWDDATMAGCLIHTNEEKYLLPYREKEEDMRTHPVFSQMKDIYSERTENIKIISEPEKNKLKKTLTKMKVLEIKKIALEKSLSLSRDNKNKTKNELIQELIHLKK